MKMILLGLPFFLLSIVCNSQQASPSTRIRVDPSDNEVLYFGSWTQVPAEAAPDRRQTNHPFSACEIVFKGKYVNYFGLVGPACGKAVLYLDGQVSDTIDAYNAIAEDSRILFSAKSLSDERMHTLRIVVLRDHHPQSIDNLLSIDGFEVSEIVDYPKELRSMAMEELKIIGVGEKTYLGPEQWKPVRFKTHAPKQDVVLLPGIFKEAFDRNIEYILHSVAEPIQNNWWVNTLPASSEGRILGAAAHSLRWNEREDLRRILNQIVDSVASRQQADGYCLPYDRSYMLSSPMGQPGKDERRNYDRMNLTRGLVAADLVGNQEALDIIRRYYDWLNDSEIYSTLMTGSYDGSAHNVNNGHPGGLLMYLSSKGKPEDLENLERFFVQDYFIGQMKNKEPLALGYYPLHVAHCYVLLAYGAWMDHYRATGNSKYLEAALGAWEVVNQYYEHVGGTIAICEEHAGDYPPQSYYLRKHTGETCGSVFWADINHRLLRHFPEDEKYATEIEKTIYNVILAAQDSSGKIRYHNHLHGKKDTPRHENTCCEVNGSPFIARLPEFIYSTDQKGLWINLFAASRIKWKHGNNTVEVVTNTSFPIEQSVDFSIVNDRPDSLSIRIRIPGWLKKPIDILVNNKKVKTGIPGTYASISKAWRNGDLISMDLPMELNTCQYTGLDQHPKYKRYALTYGPILMAFVGAHELDISPKELIEKLNPIEGKSLWFTLPDHAAFHIQPYWTLESERMTCFPVFKSVN
jgi:DUF1680 family protein